MPIAMNQQQSGNLLDFLKMLFFRMVALFLLLFALKYWIQILGITSGTNSRIDLMPEHWQIASVVLCVLLPISAVGLWGRFAWGPLVWFLVIGVEFTMYLGLQSYFGTNEYALLFHLVTLGLFLIFLLLGRLMAKKV